MIGFTSYEIRYDKTRPRKFYAIGYVLGFAVGGIIFAIKLNGLAQFTVEETFSFVTLIILINMFLMFMGALFPEK